MTPPSWLLFTLALVTVSAGADATQVGNPLKVMSFNVRYGTANDGENHWDQRQQLVLEAIRVSNPDLLGTQELLPFQGEFLQEGLPDYDFVGRSREEDGRQGEQCGIFFRRARFEKLEEGHFWLSEDPAQPGSVSWDSSLPRMVSWVRLRDRSQPDCVFLFANTHFDHRGKEARLQSAAVIRKELVERWPDLPLVLTGDFNTPVDSAPYRELIGEGGLQDSYRTIHPEESTTSTGTFGGWTGRRDGARIDWILCDPRWRTLDARIVYYQDRGRYPSDHYPVEAVLRWQDRPAPAPGKKEAP